MNDVAGVLLGLVRRLTRGGTGQPRFSEDGHRVREQAALLRHMPAHLQELIEQFPRRYEALAMRAEVALEDGDPEAALATAALLRERFPGLVVGYQIGCTALRRLRRYPEAEALARAAIRRFPRAPAAYESLAFCAQEQGDWAQAVPRWLGAARRFPDTLWIQVMAATALARQGKAEQAEAAIRAVARKWPEEFWPGYFAAEIAEVLGRWDTAGTRWVALARRFPGRMEAYQRGTRALREAGTLDRAAALAGEGLFIFPNAAALLAERDAVVAAGGPRAG